MFSPSGTLQFKMNKHFFKTRKISQKTGIIQIFDMRIVFLSTYIVILQQITKIIRHYNNTILYKTYRVLGRKERKKKRKHLAGENQLLLV